MNRLTFLLVIALGLPSLAHAQALGPEACGQAVNAANYGALTIGTAVVTQRHRFVNGDPNWEPAMGRFLGRAASVTRLSGVDDQGCPGVRLDVDDGAHFWRVRDLTIGTARPNPQFVPSAAETRNAAEGCGQTDATADYGPFAIGALVTVGRSEPVNGDANWTDAMGAYLGTHARITEHAGVDDVGCPGVLLDVDHGEWFWRIRSLTPGTDQDDGSEGLASAHGRVERIAMDSATNIAPSDQLEQACGMTDETATYGDIRTGSTVTLGRHRPVDGQTNWVEPMDAYVGQRARVTQLAGVDEQGCPLIGVDVDRGEWLWRLRDAVRAPPGPDEGPL